MPTTEKKSKPPKPSDLELESIQIEPAENGFTVKVRKRIKRERREYDYDWPRPEELVFTDARELLKAVGSRLGVKVNAGG